MAYDSQRERIVLFGGTTPNGESDETWEWDGVAWERVATTGRNPGPRHNSRMAYDAARANMVLFGDETPDPPATWLWDGAEWSFVERSPSGNKSGFACAYDLVRGRVVIHGDRSWGAGTFEWDGSDWALRSLAVPPTGRTSHVAVFLPPRGRVVMFGGYATPGVYPSELWEWDGSAWSLVPAGGSPPGRSSFVMSYDAARGRLVLAGGTSDAGVCGIRDTWEFDGSQWHQMDPGPDLPGFVGAASAYDAARGHVVMFGPMVSGCSTMTGGTWVWTARPALTRRPASLSVCEGVNAAFEVSAVGRGPFAYQWQERTGTTWSDLDAGPRPWGSTLLGVHGPELQVLQSRSQDSGDYRCVVSNACGDSPSHAANLYVACYADCDCSATLDIFDFLCFQNEYAIGAPAACDCDTSSGMGACDIFDFLCFQNAYSAGCP